MPDAYHQLLEAAILHLETLKARGVRSVTVSGDILGALRQSARGPTPVPRRQPAAPGRSQTTAEPSRAGKPPIALSQVPAPDLAPASARPAPATPDLLSAPAASSAPRPGPAAADTDLDPRAKAEAMKELRERASVCMKCPNLAGARTNVVFGVGDIHAALMFVGEAPGADEDAQGEPFVGAAGQLLTRIIQTMGLNRQTVYIANILKCRPDTPGQTSGNRKPTPEEMKTCIPYLQSQIDLIRPRVLVALGGTAVEGLLGKTEGITRLRGRWQEYRGIPLMPTFHPSYLLRNQALAEKRKVWEDMLSVMKHLEMPISEKQQGYFMRGT